MLIVYCHTCLVTGKKYVGQTKKPMARRWSEHVCHALRKTGGCVLFGRAIRKHGRENWHHEELERVATQEEADAAETKWIAQLSTLAPRGYNLDIGGGSNRDPKVGKKISAARAAKSPEWKDQQRALLRKAHAKWLASSSPAERSAKAKEAWATLTSEERSEHARKREAAMLPEDRRARARRGKANMDPARRSEIARRANAAMTSAQRQANRAKQTVAQTPEQRSDISRRAAATKKANIIARASLEMDEQ